MGVQLGAVDLGVAVEFPVDLAQGAHRAGRFEGTSVDVEIVGGNRVGLVGEVVVEPVDAPPLAAVGEIYGDVRLAVLRCA